LRPGASRDLIFVVLIVAVSTGLLGLIQGAGVVQFVINGLVVGSIYVLGATGVTLVYGVRKFANFAHGDMMTFGAYMAFLMNGLWLKDLLWGAIFATVATAVLGLLMELTVFNKLAARGPISALVASIGITIFLQNLLNVWFGTSINQYNIVLPKDIVLWSFNGVSVIRINPLRGAATLVVGIGLIVFLHLLLTRTLLGKAMRATSDNPDLARASGIKVRNVVLWTWGLSGAMAGVAGVLLGIFIDVRPGLGFNVLLFIFAAVIVGGLGSPYGAMLGGFIVGIAQELSAALLDWLGRPNVIGLENADAYRPVAAFVVMLLVLILRPGGLAVGRTAVLRTGRGIFSIFRRVESEDRE
jgi:branched-chain amino acid transport system permease protein